MAKYQGKYRIGSARLAWYDYGSAGMYFVTICTKNRVHYFGKIMTDPKSRADAQMQLNDIGRIVEDEWIKTPEIRPDMHLALGEFVVMPDHFHGIMIIGANPYNMHHGGRIAMHRDSTAMNTFGPQSKNLASIVRGFKSAVTTRVRKMGNTDFAWQSRYHDHIIRNRHSFERISQYIRNNPKNWQQDRFTGQSPS